MNGYLTSRTYVLSHDNILGCEIEGGYVGAARAAVGIGTMARQPAGAPREGLSFQAKRGSTFVHSVSVDFISVLCGTSPL